MNLQKFTVGLLLAGTFPAFCEEACKPEEQSNISCFQIGANYAHVNIKVLGNLSFHGDLGGMQGSYEYRPWNNFYGGLRAAWREGETEVSDSSRSLIYIDVQERLGYSYVTKCKSWLLTLFSGFGYRHLYHKLRQEGQPSVKFDYNEFYIPVGFLSDYFFNSWCSLGINITWMPQVYPTVKIVPLKGARWILKSTLTNMLVELPVAFFITQNKRYSLVFKPFYEHWKDGQSTAVTATGTALGLPANVYNFWGAELNFAYSF